jgi:uncharacterized LabA/DUF88 family protein
MQYTKSPKRLMVFVDGENIVCRYQAMKDNGRSPIEENSVVGGKIHHEQDIYLWRTKMPIEYGYDLIRVYYYTSVVGDDQKIQDIKDRIKKIPQIFNDQELLENNTLYPVIFKRDKQHSKGKGVDIQMTLDMLSHVYKNNIDWVYLFSGDGDY